MFLSTASSYLPVKQWIPSKLYPYLLALLVFFWGSAVSAETQNRLLILKDATTSLSVAPYLDVLEDPSQHLSLSDVMSPAYANQFIANTSAQAPSFGRSYSAVWVRFEVSNQSTQNWYLLLDATLGDQLDLFVIADDTTTTAYAQRLKHYRRALWSLHLPPVKKLRFYIRATNAGAIFNLPVELVPSKTMLVRGINDYRFSTAIYSAFLILAAYNAFLFFILREPSYLILVVHILSVFATTHRHNPVFESLAFLSNTNSYFFTTPLFIVSASLSLFVSQILQTKSCLPKFDRILKAISWLSILCIPVVGMIPSKNIIGPILLALLFITVLLTSWFAARQGEAIGKYFFAIFAVTFILEMPVLLVIIFNATHWTVRADSISGIGLAIFALLLSIIQAERVRLMRENMQSIKLADQAKDGFLASMSHELRTPLNAIFGLSTLLQLSKLNDIQSNYIKKLAASSRYMLQLIGNILDIKKIENKSFQLEAKPFDLKAVLNSIYDLLHEQARTKGLNLVFEGTEQFTEVVCADKVRLSQILINLLGNGIKYTQRGEVRLTVHKLTSSSPDLLAVRFDVTDTGIGITPNQMALLFKPFVQLETKTGYGKEGTGLGLFISKNLVEMMGGTLELKSTPDKGSQFFFNLAFPIQETTSTLAEEIIGPDAQFLLPGTRILLVDDYELNVFIWRKLLNSIGADVTVALDGKSTIMQLQQNHFDIVLIDISLPDIDGLEVTRWVRSHSQNPKVPILALTAYATPQVERQCKDAGMNGFLSKPFELHELYNIIKQTLYG